ncbi:MAG: hypothetical protein M5R42_04960 [Rhodocyclaceae bacterium]|nr:hypothetical protein [Rhodocyclaceae bacterium]
MMQLYRIRCLLCALLLGLPLSATHAAGGGDPILAARDAVQRGDRAKLARQLEAARGHVLAPYVEYWLLQLRLQEVDSAEPRDFLARHAGTYLADKLRGEWLKVLGKRQEWDVFDAEYPPLVQPDQEITCYALQNRLRLADLGALDEARPLWFSAADLPESCIPVMEQLIADKRLGPGRHMGTSAPPGGGEEAGRGHNHRGLSAGAAGAVGEDAGGSRRQSGTPSRAVAGQLRREPPGP